MSLLLALQGGGGGVTVTPGTRALILATFAPTVTATDHQLVTPAAKALTLTTFAPNVTASDHKSVTPTTAALVTAALAPTVSVSDNQTVTPSTASLVLTAFAPNVTGGQGLTVIPGTATLALTTFEPTVTATTDTAADEAAQTPAGKPARDVRRRYYIMPDGRTFFATTDEVIGLLQLYAVPKEAIAQLTAPPQAQPVIRAPQITLQKRDVRFVPTEEPNTYTAVISERFVYRAPADAYGQAQMALNRMRADDEEALLLLL